MQKKNSKRKVLGSELTFKNLFWVYIAKRIKHKYHHSVEAPAGKNIKYTKLSDITKNTYASFLFLTIYLKIKFKNTSVQNRLLNYAILRLFANNNELNSYGKKSN